MKRKLLFAVAAMFGMTMSAQTDVTSTYLVNPSFELKAEGTASTAADLGSNKNASAYYGWNTPQLGTSYCNVSIGNSTTCNGQGWGIPSAASDGDFYFFNRKGWATQAGELSQTATLPAGKYFITVDYKAYERNTTNGTLGFSINGSSILSTKPYVAVSSGTPAVNDPWKTIGAWFTVETEGEVKIAITENLVGGSARADLYLDNVRLYKWSIDDDANVAAATPETPLDVTAKYVTNPYFDSNVDGWTTTTGYQNKGRATNQGGAISGGFHENWNGSAKTSGKISYTATGLPSGTYRVTAAAFSSSASTGLYLFAGAEKTSVTVNGTAFYSVEATTKTGSLEFGLELGEGNTSSWIGIDNVRLELLEAINEIDLTPWNEAKTAAETALTNNADEALATAERAAVNNKKGVAEPTTVEGMTIAVTELNNAVAAFVNAYAADKLAADKADFVSAYNTMKATYTETVDVTFNGSCGSANGQHWSGDSRSYADTWSGSATNKANTCTMTLPAGDYAFVAAGRGMVGTSTSISVKLGDADATVYNYSAKGDAGVGIALDGSAAYDWRTADKFANNNLGRGWEWGYIEFTLTEQTEVTLSYGYELINGSWASVTDAALLCTADTKDAAALAAAAQEIMDLVNNTTVPTANIGEGAFQYSADNIALVQDQKDMYAEATASDLVEMAKYQFGEGAVAFLEAFKDGVQGDIEAMNILNKPKSNQKFNIVLTFAGWGYDNKAITYIANGRKDAGNYNIQYLAEANGNYAQAFTMTWVEGNKYKMSQIDADGVERFISTGIPYGGNTAQIRTTTDASKALLVEVRATATEGKYNLWNTEANQYIGSQDAGVFTVNSHIDFNIVEAAQIPGASISAAGYATYVAPVEVAVPAGAKAYTVEGINGTTLVLTEEVSTIAANTAVILEGAATTAEGLGYANANPAEATVTTGLLTGVYASTAAPKDAYVLQSQEGVVGFYQVGETVPTVKANRAYLTAPAATEAKAFTFGEATAIKTIEALTSGKAEIFDLNGRKLNGLQKGMNIVNGKKIMVK